MAVPSPQPAIVVMGVAGVGKTSVGERLAEWLGVPFLEGDSFHSRQNVDKMSAGVALDDADRWPWLDAIAAAIAGSPAGTLVVTCSALKRAYRRRIAAAAARPLVFVYLHASRETLVARLAARRDHFMPPRVLDSQLAALEPPAPDENAIRVSVEGPLDAVVATALEALAGVAAVP